MGATQDLELAKKTLDFILTKSKDQDVYQFFSGLGANFKTRRLLTKFFQDEYDVVRDLLWRSILERID